MGATEIPSTKKEILQKYEAFARWYDLAELLPELLGLWVLRRKLLGRARGRVLEVAVGTGRSLPHYSRNCVLTTIDLSRAMLARARRRAERLDRAVTSAVMDVEQIGFRDHCFDTVVDTMGLCTFPEPVAALREMARVCRPGGRILLLEHGRSDRKWIGRWQDRRADRHARHLGCRWNRDPLDLVRQAGLRVFTAKQTFLGIFHTMEIAP